MGPKLKDQLQKQYPISWFHLTASIFQGHAYQWTPRKIHHYIANYELNLTLQAGIWHHLFNDSVEIDNLTSAS